MHLAARSCIPRWEHTVENRRTAAQQSSKQNAIARASSTYLNSSAARCPSNRTFIIHGKADSPKSRVC